MASSIRERAVQLETCKDVEAVLLPWHAASRVSGLIAVHQPANFGTGALGSRKCPLPCQGAFPTISWPSGLQ